jgi:SSS family transporter
MHWIDWVILLATIGSIVAYGVWRTYKTSSVESYLRGDRDLRWWTIGLSIMATQASGITFLSAPGEAYTGGLGFIQIYLGLPLAMIFLSAFILPIYYRLHVFTAYEYLEQRFDVRVRQYTAFLFLLQRGLAAGLTVYAPSIILSALLNIDLKLTCLLMGGLVVFYTVLGGTKAVSVTQQQQMVVILAGLVVAFVVALMKLPAGMGFTEAMSVAGELGKTRAIDFEFNPANRYNIWSGILGGFFLSLSYFGTDQSQVQRYLNGHSLKESRMGLMFNAVLKIPMQFLVLLVGIVVLAFYQFGSPPLHFNNANTVLLAQKSPEAAAAYEQLASDFDAVHAQKAEGLKQIVEAKKRNDAPMLLQARVQVLALQTQESNMRQQAAAMIKAHVPRAETNDKDYIFLTFVRDHLPVGIIGLLLAVIFSASMSSTSSELNALATTTVIDFYRRSWAPGRTDRHYFAAAKIFTLVWGGLILVSAITSSLFENLIQAVNLIGSVFYGTILGIFLCAFFIKYLNARSVLIGGIVGQLIILYLKFYSDVAFLWFNMLGAACVIATALVVESLWPSARKELG